MVIEIALILGTALSVLQRMRHDDSQRDNLNVREIFLRAEPCTGLYRLLVPYCWLCPRGEIAKRPLTSKRPLVSAVANVTTNLRAQNVPVMFLRLRPLSATFTEEEWGRHGPARFYRSL